MSAQQQGLVDACLYHMTKKPLTVDYDDEISSRVDAIAVMVNLACAEENKIMLVYHPGLLDVVINISNHDPIDEAREHAAIVLMNLVREQHRKSLTSMVHFFSNSLAPSIISRHTRHMPKRTRFTW